MFARLIGNDRAKETLRRMLRSRRVPGTLLFAGEEAIGKKQFAIEVAKALNCLSPREAEGCDQCSSCIRLSRFAAQANGEAEPGKTIRWSEHRDVGLGRVGCDEREEAQRRSGQEEAGERQRELLGAERARLARGGHGGRAVHLLPIGAWRKKP